MRPPSEGSIPNLDQAVSQVGQDVQQAEDAFNSIYQDISQLKDETSLKIIMRGQWPSPFQHASISKYRTKWRGCHNKFHEMVWESRKVAGSARSRLDEYIQVQIPIMLDSSIGLAQRKQSLQEMIANSGTDRKSAELIAQHMESLHGDVREILVCISSLSLSNKSRSLSESIESLASVLKYKVKPPVDMGDVLKVLHIDSNGFTLLEKLGAICNVWAAITSALQEIYERLRIQQASTQVLTFDRRTELLNQQLETLRDTLEKYQTTVIAREPSPAGG